MNKEEGFKLFSEGTIINKELQGSYDFKYKEYQKYESILGDFPFITAIEWALLLENQRIYDSLGKQADNTGKLLRILKKFTFPNLVNVQTMKGPVDYWFYESGHRSNNAFVRVLPSSIITEDDFAQEIDEEIFKDLRNNAVKQKAYCIEDVKKASIDFEWVWCNPKWKDQTGLKEYFANWIREDDFIVGKKNRSYVYSPYIMLCNIHQSDGLRYIVRYSKNLFKREDFIFIKIMEKNE